MAQSSMADDGSFLKKGSYAQIETDASSPEGLEVPVSICEAANIEFVLDSGFMEMARPLEKGDDGQTGSVENSHEHADDIPELLSDLPEAPIDEELVHLRELLFARELSILQQLQDKLGDSHYNAKKFSRVISEAILLRSGKDNTLTTALEPVVDDIIQVSLRRKQRDFVNALFPLMGPSIRKSIAESFRSMLDSFSKSVEMAFSWKGLRWRFEALRAGKPFSEIVMLNTLVYRVEQIFFIHSETGLVLSHMVNEGVGSQDADMVSAMLTAIQDFVRDCFTSGSDSDLESLQLGEFTIIIEKSALAYLACVVRGTPPAGFHEQLRVTLELMLIEYADELVSFNGDTAPFIGATRFLDACMLSHFVDDNRRLPLWAKVLPVMVVLALAGGFGYFTYHQSQLMEQKNAFLSKMHTAVSLLRNEPGFMVNTVIENENGPWEIVALKDELAKDPTEILRNGKFNSELFTFKLIPYISYDPSIILRRAEQSIELPEGVTMRLDSAGTLSFEGTAPMDWIVATRSTARSLPGVKKVDIQKLRDPNMEYIAQLIKKVENTVIEFPLGKDTPIAKDLPKLTQAVNALVELEKVTKAMGFTISLTIYGHADHVGRETRNYEISQARTKTVAAMLYARGSSMPISMYGMGSQYPRPDGEAALEDASQKIQGSQASRRIEMRVHIMQPPTADLNRLLP